MFVQDAIRQRRSVKHFDPTHRLSVAERDQLIELAMLAPTSFNIQNWRFVVVEDATRRAQIREAAWGQSQVTDASLLVILCADLKAFERNPERYWKDAPLAARNQLVPMIVPFYANQPELQRDEAMRSCGLAGATLMLAAKSMGLDSCPLIGFDPKRVAEIIQLPADHVISFMITIGRALKPAMPRGGQLERQEVLIVEQFSKSSTD